MKSIDNKKAQHLQAAGFLEMTSLNTKELNL